MPFLIFVLVFFILSAWFYFSRDKARDDNHKKIFAFAGETINKALIDSEEINGNIVFSVGNNVFNLHDPYIWFVHVVGDSMKGFKNKISNNDRLIADDRIKTSTLKKGDVIVLLKIKPNGDKYYKLRSFVGMSKDDANVMLSETKRVLGDSKPSEHNIDGVTKDKKDGCTHRYIAKVIAKDLNYNEQAA